MPVSTMPMFFGYPSFLYFSICLLMTVLLSFPIFMQVLASSYIHFLHGWILVYNGTSSRSYCLTNFIRSPTIWKLPSIHIDMSYPFRYLCGHIFNIRCCFIGFKPYISFGIDLIFQKLDIILLSLKQMKSINLSYLTIGSFKESYPFVMQV